MAIQLDFTESSTSEDDTEKNRCRIELLNDSNYGAVLCFLDKFGSMLDLPRYPFQNFEDDLITNDNQIPSGLINFHLILLKRLSLAKNAQPDRFDSIISRFASRFNINDSEQILKHGYLRVKVALKIRVIKNLLESQFDSNQKFKNLFRDRAASEITSSPIGYDRFGGSYWYYSDGLDFIRLFREDVNVDYEWANIAKNQDELKSFICLLTTDSIVRKRFPEWNINDEQFSSLSISNEFEKCYDPNTKSTCQRQSSKKSCEIFHNDDMQMSTVIRRSSRISKTLPAKSGDISISEKDSQVFDKKNKNKSQTNRNTRNNQKRKSKSQRTFDDRFCSTASSSDENINYESDDDYDSDDYLPNQSEIDLDKNFFELDENIDAEDQEQIFQTKTAKALNTIPNCSVCTKNDRPDVLLLCNYCDEAYHLECLRPILLSIPNYDWLCPLCQHKQLVNCLIEKLNVFYFAKIANTVLESEQVPPTSNIQMTISNSNSTTAFTDDNTNNVSQRGRHRRSRFNLNEILKNESEEMSTNLELPKKMTRLLPRSLRSTIKSTIQTKSKRLHRTTTREPELNEELDSPLVYINTNDNCYPQKSFSISNKQTVQIRRRWNDLQRRRRLKLLNMRITQEISTFDDYQTGDSFCDSENSQSQSSVSEIKSNYVLDNKETMDQYSMKNIEKQLDFNFDRLTRDIQFALNLKQAPFIERKSIDRTNVKRLQNSKLLFCTSKISLINSRPITK